MANLKDSGARIEFPGGAVRDCPDGKGRCDLLPLDVVYELILKEYNAESAFVILDIGRFMKKKKTKNLFDAITSFCFVRKWDVCTAIIEASIQYEDGAHKYAERNWEKGINLHNLIDSGIRHYLKWLRKDTDEPHDRAFVWNMLGAIWTIDNKPEFDDIPTILIPETFMEN